MKKLLLFITLFSFYGIVAMDQPPLKKDLNVQDELGNTALHNALIAWANYNKIAREWECAHICNQIGIQFNAKQCKTKDANTTREALDAEDKAILNKVEQVKAKYISYLRQADSYKKTAVQLIENGARISIPNVQHQTVEQLYPSFIETFVYDPLHQAIVCGDILALEKYLRNGGNRICNCIAALQYSIDSNKPESAKILLFGGAKLSTTNRLGNDTINPLHLAANRGTYAMVETLLCSPQGSPSVSSSTYNDRTTQQEMFTFLCCMHRNKKTLPEIPADVRRTIYKFVFPDPETLIDLVPLQQILKYIKFLGKTTLVNALTKRHIKLLEKVMNTYSVDHRRFVTEEQLPHQFPRLSSLNGIDLLKDEKAVRRALDPANLEEHRETIEANYIKLLE